MRAKKQRDWWEHLYYFEVEFADGSKHQQEVEDRPVQRVAEERGKQATCIRLVPQRPDLKTVEAPIPDGALPFYARRTRLFGKVTEDGAHVAGQPSVWFCIGWEHAGARAILKVASASGAVMLGVEPC